MAPIACIRLLDDIAELCRQGHPMRRFWLYHQLSCYSLGSHEAYGNGAANIKGVLTLRQELFVTLSSCLSAQLK